MTTRIPPLPPKEWPREVIDAAMALRAPAGHPMAAASGPDRPKGLAAIGSFAHHPALAKAFFPFNGHVLHGTTLPVRLRAIVVLRVAVKRQAAYAWAQHVFNGRDAGLTDEEISRIAFGPDAPFLVPLDATVIRSVDELIDDGMIGEDTWQALAAELDEQQLFDLIFTVGCYETISFFMRSIGLEVDPTIPDLLAAQSATEAPK